jgi:hypothetical protein
VTPRAGPFRNPYRYVPGRTVVRNAGYRPTGDPTNDLVEKVDPGQPRHA